MSPVTTWATSCAEGGATAGAEAGGGASSPETGGYCIETDEKCCHVMSRDGVTLSRSSHASHPHMFMLMTGIKTLCSEFPIDKLLIVNSTNQYVATFLDC